MTPELQEFDKWQDTYTIHSFQVNTHKHARLSAVCELLQESAWNHAEHLGVGFSNLIEKNLIWVLSRMRIRIQTFPRWGDTIKIQTWPTGKDRLFCYRDFVITTATDTLVGLATSTWFVVDTQNRKPQKTATYIDLDSTTTGKRVFSRFAQKLKPISDVDQQKTLFVRYSDLDVNEHVNNAQFIKFLTDGLELSFLNTHELSELEINYMAEAQLDDKLSVGSTTNGDECIHQIIREKDETELVRARTVWRN